MANRRKPLGGSGALAVLLIAPREFLYTFCVPCQRKLFYTYTGEKCPFCKQFVMQMIIGNLPADSALRQIAGY